MSNSEMNLVQFCREVLKAHGASESEELELLIYNQNAFTKPSLLQLSALPAEPYLATWAEYVRESAIAGSFAVLQSHLVQLQFPVVAGISENLDYRAATRTGKSTSEMLNASGLVLNQPEGVQVYIHPTLAGAIPVIAANNRADFVSLLQALTKRNEPQPIPASMGACIVSGYNNWQRVRQYQEQWLLSSQKLGSNGDWAQEFQHLVKQPELYQDRFILLSQGNYSNIAADELGLPAQQWLELSAIIRIEHECTHYITRRLFGSMRNNILDEIIADYRGIVAACGVYRSDWFLAFVGLADFPLYSPGGRLENYLGDPPLSAGAFLVLQRLVKAAAENLELFDRQFGELIKTNQQEIAFLLALTTMRLEELASEQALSILQLAFKPKL